MNGLVARVWRAAELVILAVRDAPLTNRQWAQLVGAVVLPLIYVISRL